MQTKDIVWSSIVIMSISLFCFSNQIEAVSTITPHDKEYEQGYMLCKKCHGIDIAGNIDNNSIFGEPTTGAHTIHVRYDSGKSPSTLNLFRNDSYKKEDGAIEQSMSEELISAWDICDQCHKVPRTLEKNEDSHLNKKIDISPLSSESLFNFNDTDKSCSNVGSGVGKCHEKFGDMILQWGTAGKGIQVSTYTKNAQDYYEEYKKYNCVICHYPSLDMTRDNKTVLFLKSDVVSMCNDCHGENKRYETKVSHPLNIKIDEQLFTNNEILDKFGMDKYYFNSITCVTCHEPHGESCRSCHFNFNNEKIYKIKDVLIEKKKLYLKIEEKIDIEFNTNLHSFKKEIFFQNTSMLEDPELKKVRDSLCNPCHTLETSLKVDVKDPHKEKKCIHCHRTIPTDPDEMCINIKAEEVTDIKYRKGVSRVESFIKFDILTLCNNCHRDKEHLHPINVKVKAKVPDDFKLDEWGQITCVTCHEPHINYSNKKEVLLYKREGDKDGLCSICHANEPDFIKNNPHDYNNKNKCGFCHATISTTTKEGMENLLARKPDIYSKDYNAKCNICHKKEQNTHPIKVFLAEDIASNYRLDIQEQVTCGTCHDYHFVDKIIIKPGIKKGRKDFCSQCHRDLDEMRNTLEELKKESVK